MLQIQRRLALLCVLIAVAIVLGLVNLARAQHISRGKTLLPRQFQLGGMFAGHALQVQSGLTRPIDTWILTRQ